VAWAEKNVGSRRRQTPGTLYEAIHGLDKFVDQGRLDSLLQEEIAISKIGVLLRLSQPGHARLPIFKPRRSMLLNV
jgi:hypothetical protein